MGTARDIEARTNQDGEITHFGCSKCLWIIPYGRVNIFKSRFRPEEIAVMFFNGHDCEAHKAPAAEPELAAGANEAA